MRTPAVFRGWISKYQSCDESIPVYLVDSEWSWGINGTQCIKFLGAGLLFTRKQREKEETWKVLIHRIMGLVRPVT